MGKLVIYGDLTGKKHRQTYLVGGFNHFSSSIIYGIILPIHYIFQDG
jgi:hypothetical protein